MQLDIGIVFIDFLVGTRLKRCCFLIKKTPVGRGEGIVVIAGVLWERLLFEEKHVCYIIA